MEIWGHLREDLWGVVDGERAVLLEMQNSGAQDS